MISGFTMSHILYTRCNLISYSLGPRQFIRQKGGDSFKAVCITCQLEEKAAADIL